MTDADLINRLTDLAGGNRRIVHAWLNEPSRHEAPADGDGCAYARWVLTLPDVKFEALSIIAAWALSQGDLAAPSIAQRLHALAFMLVRRWLWFFPGSSDRRPQLTKQELEVFCGS